ncbi:T9SS type A sorting domain-containing protein [Mucilaginibacter yixingensis]|uniref:T9SS type A sorting domain-containing protein n=1 Tax=Mucilaginibacter yixingensis TaxID=1295612 RepID=UPI0014744339|nr:T9SS type A sorting domain-containing protein [Mucilaginibacter yixingensis]
MKRRAVKKLIYLLIFFFLATPNAKAYTYTWTGLGGLLSTSWNNYLNWSGGPLFGLPTKDDDVIIPPVALGGLTGGLVLTNATISSGNNAACKSLTFESNNVTYLSNSVSTILTVDGTLAVGGAIKQTYKTGTGSTTITLTGQGTVTCASLSVGDNSTTPSPTVTSSTIFDTNVSKLTVTGATTVNSYGNSNGAYSGVFYVTNDNTSTTSANLTTGSLALVTPSSNATSNIALLNNSASSTANGINLKLTDPSPISIPTTPYGTIDLYKVTGSNTGSIKVEYAATSGSQQIVYTAATSGLDTSPALYQDITFSGTVTKQFNSGAVTINGNWTSKNGKVNATTNSPSISFQGSSAQTLADSASNSGTGMLFKTVGFSGGGTKTISNSMGGTSIFSVSAKGTLTMGSNTTLTVGSTGKLILVSDGTGDATVATIPSTSAITGTVNVQRFFKNGTVAANTRNYRLLSSAVNTSGAMLLNYLNNTPGVFTGGPSGSTNGFTVTSANSTIYLYKENLSSSNASFNSGNFKGVTKITSSTINVYNNAGTADTTVTLYPANGFMLYYAGNNVSNLTNKQTRVNGVYADPDSATTTGSGTLNQGPVTAKLWWNNSTTLSYTKSFYNLAGNPYPSAIDWDTFSNSSSSAAIYGPGVSSSIYVYNYTNKNYGIYQTGTAGGIGTNNATRYIATGQGFFVQTTSNTASLTFTESAKTGNQPASLGSSYLLMGLPVQAAASPQYLRVRLAKDSVNYDESIITFESDASNDYENGKDAPRLDGMGNVATLATYDSGKTQMLAINHLHSIDATSRVKLYVGMTGTASLDTLNITGFSSLDKRFDVFLIDHYKKDSLQISLYNKYMFNIRPDSAASYGADRFELVFHPKGDYNYRLLSFTGKPANSTIQLNWQTEREQNLTSFTIQKADGTSTYMPVYNLQSDGNGKYSYIDKTPTAGANHYRLIQNDPFGKISSTDLTVNFTAPTTAEQQALSIYPNPVATQMNVKINANNIPAYVALKVLNLNGQTLIRSVQDGENIQQNTSSLMPGVYIVEITDDKTKQLIGRTKITKP